MELTYMNMTLLFMAWCLFLTLFYVYYMSSNHRLFKRIGVPTPPVWPVVGNMMQEMGKGGPFVYHETMYQKYKKDKAYGMFRANLPTLVICNLDLIREICVKQFHNFTNRQSFDLEEPLGSAMTDLKDDHWKKVRSIVSPSFNTARLKRLFPHIERKTNLLLEYFKEKHENNEPVELRDELSAFTMDTIAGTGFGLEIDSLREKNSEFTKQSKALAANPARFMILAIFLKFLRPLFRKLGVSMLDKEALGFFTRFVDQAIEARKQESSSRSGRSDFIQLMLEAESDQQSEGEKNLSYDDIRGQAFIFLIAGFETTATALSFTLFLIATNPECRDKVQEEVDTVLQGKFPDYESVQSLTYLDMCLNESMRMFPPGYLLDRMTENDCEIEGVKIPGGVSVTFPVGAIHNDPEIWENPRKFDPERFTPENKAKRHPYAFLGFGQGPRNCIGMRLAMLVMKVSLAAILQKLTPVSCEKTVTPPVFNGWEPRAADGLWVKMELRK